MGLFILGAVLVLYGVFCLYLAILKSPQWVWNMGKIEGFKKILGELGTQIFIGVWGAAATVGGIILAIYNWPF